MRKIKYPGLAKLTILNLLLWVPIVWICVAACMGTPDVTNDPNDKGIMIEVPGKVNTDVYIVILDSCQYYYGYHVLTHKGNCNNPIHQNQCK